MATAGQKTVRFTQVVKRAGEPQVHTLWVAPAKDPELQRAEKAHRVMTVHASQVGGKTDVGVIGFDPEAGRAGQFLIFPKSLKSFAGARVVGIKFDLVEQPKLSAATVPKTFAVAAPPARSAEPKAPPQSNKRAAPENSSTDNKAERATVVAFKAEASEKEEKAPEDKPTPKEVAPKVVPPPSPQEISSEVLIREIRAALRELKAGKAVAAYQRLERAITK